MQVVWEGNWIAPNGHATVTRNMTKALRRQGIDVKLKPTEMPPPERYQAFVQPSFLAMMQRPYRADAQRIRILHRTPPDFHQTHDLLTVGMTYSEATEIPQEWAAYVNTTVSALIVANEQSAAAFAAAGVQKPVWVVPHGVDTQVFRPKFVRTKDALQMPPFRFLSIFEWVPRKGYDFLAKAFWTEFQAHEDVCLIMKTRSFSQAPKGVPSEELRRLKEQFGTSESAPIFLYDGELSQTRLAQLYQACSAFVLPTRGESVGLPLLEAAASELPIITTAWGGPLEFLSPENAYLVNYALAPVPSEALLGGQSLKGFWAEPDLLSLRHQMRQVYEHYVLAKSKAERLRQHILSTRSWNACATVLSKHLEQAVGKPLC